MTFYEVARRVRERLGQEHRYAHCVRVARTAELLAQAHALDTRRARLAGMLHDLARLYDAPRLLDESRRRGLAIDAHAAAHPVVLHAPLGAEIAREAFHVEDEAVLSAIRKHTLGDAYMSALDCAVFLADSLEPGRAFDGRAELLALAHCDLREAMRASLASSVRYLAKRGLTVAPQTVLAARNFGLDIATEMTVAQLEVSTA